MFSASETQITKRYLVIAWDSDIDEFERWIGVTEADYGHTYIGGLGYSLMVNTRIRNNQ